MPTPRILTLTSPSPGSESWTSSSDSGSPTSRSSAAVAVIVVAGVCSTLELTSVIAVPPAPSARRLRRHAVLVGDEVAVHREERLRQRDELEDLVDRALGLDLALGEPDGQVVLAAPVLVGDVGRHEELDVGVRVVAAVLDLEVRLVHADGELRLRVRVVDLEVDVGRGHLRADLLVVARGAEDAAHVLVNLFGVLEVGHLPFPLVEICCAETRRPIASNRKSEARPRRPPRGGIHPPMGAWTAVAMKSATSSRTSVRLVSLKTSWRAPG